MNVVALGGAPGISHIAVTHGLGGLGAFVPPYRPAPTGGGGSGFGGLGGNLGDPALETLFKKALRDRELERMLEREQRPAAPIELWQKPGKKIVDDDDGKEKPSEEKKEQTDDLAEVFEPTFIFVEPKEEKPQKEIIVIVEYAQPGVGAAPALAPSAPAPLQLGWFGTAVLWLVLIVGLGAWLASLTPPAPPPAPGLPPRRKRRKVRRRRA